MNRKWYGLGVNMVLAVLVVSGAVFARAFPKRLVVADAGSGKVYGAWAVPEEFAVEFIHSVNQSPVRETFRAEGREIRPVAVRFTSFGAGMQSELGEGEELARDGDALIITGFTRSFKALNYIVGTVSDHILFINNQRLSLRDLCGRNAHITIRIKSVLAGRSYDQ
jgi:hypothetical protein